MKKLILAILTVLSSIGVYSQGSSSRENRNVPAFTGIDVSGGIDLVVRNGSQSVAVEAADATIRDHIVTEVKNGILQIHLENDWEPHMSDPRMKAFVSVQNLKKLGGSGGGNIVFQNLITADDLYVSLSGGGGLKGKLNANRLNLVQSGGSNVDLAGNVKNLDVNASGGSTLGSFDLITDYAAIQSSGGSASELTANKELRVVSSGGGEVTYRGAAVVKQIQTSGGGSVTHKD